MAKANLLRGSNTPWLLAAGLLIVFLLFRPKTSISAVLSAPVNKPLPPQVNDIVSYLTNAGYDPQTALYWGAVSGFETGRWTSDLYTQYHNLFGMGYPTWGVNNGVIFDPADGNKSSFVSDAQSIQNLITYLQKENYPKSFDSLDSLVRFMQTKGYFTAGLEAYRNGVQNVLDSF